MTMSELGTVHFAAAIMAMVMGLFVFPAAKGTNMHRAMGAGYVVAMVALNVTALSMYRLTGTFNAFHVLALIALAAVVAGMWPLVHRREGWLQRHYRPMVGSYLGLWAAAVTETVTRVPAMRSMIPTRESIIVFGVSVAVLFFVLSVLVNRRLRQVYA